MLLLARKSNMRLRSNLIATLSFIAILTFWVRVSNAIPLNFTIQFDDSSIPGTVNWTGFYTVDSTTGLLTKFEATICRPAAPLDCLFNNLFNVSVPAVDDPDDNDNVATDVLTPTNSAILVLRDGTTNEWQIIDPFGSLTHGTYATTRVPEPESLVLCLSGMLVLLLIQRRSVRRRFRRDERN